MWPVSSVTHPTESAEVVQVLSKMEDCILQQVSTQEDHNSPTTQELLNKKVQNGDLEVHCTAPVLEGEETKARLENIQPWPNKDWDEDGITEYGI